MANSNVNEQRRELYEQVARGLIQRYEELRKSGLERGMSGNAAEGVLKSWIEQWLPKRFSIRGGAVISVQDPPTNQMDCLLFDQMESPVFYTEGGTDILPVDGIAAAVELNYGQGTTYSKLKQDAQKLSLLGRLARHTLRRHGTMLSHLPPDADPGAASAEEILAGRSIHMGLLMRPLEIIFAEDIEGSLEEAASRIAAHNQTVGVRESVDALFVLRKGFALHLDANKTGWTSQRMTGSMFASLPASEGQVLLKMQTVILNHLFLSGKTHPSSFDSFVSIQGQFAKELAEATIATDSSYQASSGDDGFNVRG